MDVKVCGVVIVVLELIIIIYGMFYFGNLEMVKSVEVIICEVGVVLVMIVVIDGMLYIGFENE